MLRQVEITHFHWFELIPHHWFELFASGRLTSSTLPWTGLNKSNLQVHLMDQCNLLLKNTVSLFPQSSSCRSDGAPSRGEMGRLLRRLRRWGSFFLRAGRHLNCARKNAREEGKCAERGAERNSRPSASASAAILAIVRCQARRRRQRAALRAERAASTWKQSSRGAEAARARLRRRPASTRSHLTQAMPLFAATLQNINSFFTIYKEQCVLIDNVLYVLTGYQLFVIERINLIAVEIMKKHDDSSRWGRWRVLTSVLTIKMENSFAWFLFFCASP